MTRAMTEPGQRLTPEQFEAESAAFYQRVLATNGLDEMLTEMRAWVAFAEAHPEARASTTEGKGLGSVSISPAEKPSPSLATEACEPPGGVE